MTAYYFHAPVCDLANGRTILKHFRTGELAIEQDYCWLREPTGRELAEYWQLQEEKARLDAEARIDDEAKHVARTDVF